MPSSGFAHPFFQVRCTRTRAIYISPFSAEPIGGAKPKFSQDSKSNTFVRESGSMLSLMCPAQGSPIPSFRLVRRTSIEVVLFFRYRTNWWIKTQVFPEVRESHLHGTVRGSACFAMSSPGITHSIIQVRRGKNNCFAFPFP